MTSSHPESVRWLARFARDKVGGEQRAMNYYDDEREVSVPVLQCLNTPHREMRTVTTLALHRHPNILETEDIRVEFMMHANVLSEEVNNVVASAALNVIKSGWIAAPGVVYPGLIAEYIPSTEVPHVMWSEPQFWPELTTIEVPETGRVHWLTAVPISELERNYLLENGFVALGEALRDAPFPWWDLNRPSMVL